MSWEGLTNKFKDYAMHGTKPLTDEKIEYLIQTIYELENVDDVWEIIRLLG